MNKRILLFSSVEWNWMKQRPHFLASELAKQGCCVTYLAINPEESRNEQLAENLQLCEITDVRGYMRTMIMRIVARNKISIILRKSLFDTVILTNPVQLQMLPKRIYKRAQLVYDCMDLMPAFYEGKRKQLIEATEAVLCHCADVITASSSVLGQYLVDKYGIPKEKCHIICNALCPEDCQKAMESKKIENIRHPAMIYMGSADYWLDLQTLEKFMRGQSRWHLYIVGNVKPEIKLILNSLPNCHILGKLDHLEALRYVNSSDVALLPFRTGGLVDMVDPVKLYEYLALDKPVVSTYWPALDHFKSMGKIAFYHGETDFANQLENVQKAAVECEKNIDIVKFANKNSWENRAKDLLNFINQ